MNQRKPTRQWRRWHRWLGLAVALPVLRHRIMLNFEARAEAVDVDTLIRGVLSSVPEQN